MASTGTSIAVEPRPAAGTIASRHLRQQGRIPCVVYGNQMQNLLVAAEAKALTKVLGHRGVIILELPDGARHSVLLREVQRDHLRQLLLHVDFQEVRMDQEITISVRLETLGTPAGASLGGMLDQMYREVQVRGLPAALPETIEVSVAAMQIGDAIRLRDLVLPPGLTLAEDKPDQIACHVILPRMKEVAAPAAEEAAAAEAAPGEEGEKAAEGAEGKAEEKGKEGKEGKEGKDDKKAKDDKKEKKEKKEK